MRGMIAVSMSLALATACATAPGRPLLRTAPRSGTALAWVLLRPLPENFPDDTLHVARVALVNDKGEEQVVELSRADVTRKDPLALIARAGLAPGRFREVQLDLAPAEHSGLTVSRLTAPVSAAIGEGQGAVLALELRWPEEGGPGAAALQLRAEALPTPPVGVTALAVCRDDDSVAVLDKRTGALAGVVPVGRHPEGLALDRNRRRAYVALAGDDALQSIDLDQMRVLARQPLRIGDEPIDAVLTPDARTLLVALRGANALSFVDTGSLSESVRVEVGNGPRSVLLDAAGRRAYVFNTRGTSISVVDVLNRAVIATVALDAGPVRGAFNRQADRLYVLHETAPYVTVVDVATLAVVQRLNMSVPGTALLLDVQSDRLYVGRRDGAGLDVYDPLSLIPVDTLPLNGQVRFLAVDGDTNTLLAALADSSGVAARALFSRAAAWQTALPGDVAYLVVAGGR